MGKGSQTSFEPQFVKQNGDQVANFVLGKRLPNFIGPWAWQGNNGMSLVRELYFDVQIASVLHIRTLSCALRHI